MDHFSLIADAGRHADSTRPGCHFVPADSRGGPCIPYAANLETLFSHGASNENAT